MGLVPPAEVPPLPLPLPCARPPRELWGYFSVLGGLVDSTICSSRDMRFSWPTLPAGARPIARRAAAARVLATAAPLQHAAAGNGAGNGAVQPQAVQQVAVTEPVAVAAPVQIMGVIPPAAVYQAVRLGLWRLVVKGLVGGCGGVA